MTAEGLVAAQALALGLGERWEKVKDAYAHANRALGDIVKVTPSSKVPALSILSFPWPSSTHLHSCNKQGKREICQQPLHSSST